MLDLAVSLLSGCWAVKSGFSLGLCMSWCCFGTAVVNVLPWFMC